MIIFFNCLNIINIYSSQTFSFFFLVGFNPAEERWYGEERWPGELRHRFWQSLRNTEKIPIQKTFCILKMKFRF